MLAQIPPSDGAPEAASSRPAGSTAIGEQSPGSGEDFSCPRCGRSCAARFYGPCTRCRAELVANLGGVRREVKPAEFVPSLNVVANHVATKD